jgi:hypothetical protein
MGKAKRKKAPAITIVGPTDEQQRRGQYERAKGSHRRVAVIETMLTRGQITDSEYLALAHYRDQAHLAERSPTKSCLDRSQGGGDIMLPAAVVSALIETGRIERDLGSLLSLVRSVAVDDMSLTEWCIGRHGGRERYDGKGNFIAMVPIGEARVMKFAILELKMGARRVMAAKGT